MEYHLRPAAPLGDISGLRDAVCAMDPSALVDTATDGLVLRISAALGAEELARALRRGGLVATAGDLELQPSVCCGGCSG